MRIILLTLTLLLTGCATYPMEVVKVSREQILTACRNLNLDNYSGDGLYFGGTAWIADDLTGGQTPGHH